MTLDKYTLHRDRSSEEWRPEKEGSGRAKLTYDTKAEARKDLRSDIGSQGGSVRLRQTDNAIQEECTFPRSKDPCRSKGWQLAFKRPLRPCAIAFYD